MQSKLYVGNLPFSMDEESLRELFQEIGEVKRVHIEVTDDCERSKGYGYVEMADPSQAEQAMQRLHQREVDGYRIEVDFQRPRGPRGSIAELEGKTPRQP